MITLHHYLWVSAILFAMGMMCILLRRNTLLVFMGLELNLNAANLALAAFSAFTGRVEGQVFVFFLIAIAAAEVAVGLAILVALYRRIQSVGTDDLRTLKG